MTEEIFAYSVYKVGRDDYDNEVISSYSVRHNLSGIIYLLKKWGIGPHELLEESPVKIKLHCKDNSFDYVSSSEIIEPNVLSKEELNKIEEEIEAALVKQEKLDEENRKNKWFCGISGVFRLQRKDKQKYIDATVLRNSWRYKDL